MKTLGFKISKKLSDLGLLDNVETEYIYAKLENGYNLLNKYSYIEKEDIKTLTLEEAIEFLPIQINNYYFIFGKNDNGYWCNYLEKDEDELYILSNALLKNICNKKTLLEAIEQMIEYLLDNDLLC